MEALNVILLLFIIVCAVAVAVTKNLLSAVIIFMAQGLVLSVVWILLRSPDLAITEAAVGAGISSILMFAALKKIKAIGGKEEQADEKEK
ncbi:MAG: DUF4040 domain-containing protein [Clostridia bacterium]|jgi:uncharacterized MnhB-related membrane protein|nr:DUF4040 domain-containing protein [Clostridia bacterium]